MPMSAVELCAAALVKIGARPFAAFEEDSRRGGLRAPPLPDRPRPAAGHASLVVHAGAGPAAARGGRTGRRLRACLRAAGRSSAHGLGRHRGPQPGHGLPGPGRAGSSAMPRRSCSTTSGASPETELPAFFVPLLVTRLAAEFCIPLTEGSSRAMDLYRLAEAELRSARLIDSQQTTPQALRRLHPDRGTPRMSRAFVTKTSFTAGELDPLLRGRLDLKAQEDGAARLRNVVVHPSGGVSRRPGPAPGRRRCPAPCACCPSTGPTAASCWHSARTASTSCAMARSSTRSPTRCGVRRRSPTSAPRAGATGCCSAIRRCRPRSWSATACQAGSCATGSYEQSLDDVGPAARPVPVRAVRRDRKSRSRSMTARSRRSPPAASSRSSASEPVFTPDHIDAVDCGQGQRTSASSTPTRWTRSARSAWRSRQLKDGKPTRDWQEQAFSEAHGWPACVAVHQERLVIGGSRDVPDRLWFSKTGHPFNFDPGTGLDDEAISFRLAGDEQHAIRGLLPGRLLQVFTIQRRVGRPRRPDHRRNGRGRVADAHRLLAGPPARPGRGRRRRPVRRRLRARAARVPLRRERAGLPGGRHRIAVAPSAGGAGGPALRPAAPLAAGRARRRQAGRRSRSTATATSSPGACWSASGADPLGRDPRWRAAFSGRCSAVGCCSSGSTRRWRWTMRSR